MMINELTMDRKLSPNESYDFNSMCRSCLSRDKDLTNMFQSDIHVSSNENPLNGQTHFDNGNCRKDFVPLYLALNAFTQIEVEKEDEFPTNICNDCNKEIRRAFAFHQMCVKNDEELRQYIQLRKHGKLIPKSEINLDFEQELNSLVQDENIFKTSENYVDDACEDYREIPDDGQSEFEEDLKNDLTTNSPSCTNKEMDKKDYSSSIEDVPRRKSLRKTITRSPISTLKQSPQSVSPTNDTIIPTTKLSRNKEPKFTCELCSSHYCRLEHLRRHHRQMHADTIQIFVCDICKKIFKRKDNLQAHMRLHFPTIYASKPKERTFRPPKPSRKEDKLFSCELCGNRYSRIENFEKHTKLANCNERFTCEICNRSFRQKRNLQSHMRMHSDKKKKGIDVKLQLCIYCGRSFSTSSNLTIHMRRHTGEKPYKCDICDKGFPRSTDLVCHKRTHTGEKKCLCTLCGKAFSRKNKLDRHMRVHTGVRPYKCTFCDRAFTQSNDLTLHIRRHTGEKPYVCGVCGERFIQGTALRAHRKQSGHIEEVKTQRIPKTSVNYMKRLENSNPFVNLEGSLPSSLSSTQCT